MKKIYQVFKGDHELKCTLVCSSERELISRASSEYWIDLKNEDNDYFYECLDHIDGFDIMVGIKHSPKTPIILDGYKGVPSV